MPSSRAPGTRRQAESRRDRKAGIQSAPRGEKQRLAPMPARLGRILWPLALTVVCAILLLQVSDLTVSDLGRHLKNGETILSGSWQERQAVLHTNFYSYAEGDFPFINHHWLAGVVLFLFWRAFSFGGLTILYAVLVSAAFLIFCLIAQRASSAMVAAPLAAIVLPVITWRDEVRPEAFTYLFAGVFFGVLFEWSEGRLKDRWLYLLPPVMLLWVNLHIGFIFGFLLLGMFCIKSLAGERQRIRTLFSATALSCVAGLLNPSGLRGLLYPLNIYRNYGYAVIEDQSIFHPPGGAGWEQQYHLFEILLGLTAATFVWRWLTHRPGMTPRWVEVLFLGSVGLLATSAIRHFPVFGLFAAPILARMIHENAACSTGRPDPGWLRAAGAAGCVVGLFYCWQQLDSRRDTAGIGLRAGVNSAAEFLKTNHIAGPIFNDFNNGSYLIFHRFHPGLSDKSDSNGGRVFVDNRPEGYPASFFASLLKMQADEQAWREADVKYHFNAIVFSLQYNNRPETESFLLARVRDPEWAPVFADLYNLIYLRRDQGNAAVIKAYEIPRDQFR